MSFLSSLAAPVLSIAGGLFGQSQAQSHADNAAKEQFERQQELMKIQHDYQVADYKHRYQWSAQDMRAAGLNPILAATQGIGGSIAGVSAGAASQAQTPMQDFGRLGEVFNSAQSISNQKEIAKMENDIKKGDLELRRLDINSAIEKRRIDAEVEKGRFELDKEQVHQSMRIAEEMKDAQIKNMVDRLRAEIEHWERQDMSSAAMASAAMASANAQQAMAEIAEREGISRNNLREAQKILIEMETGSEAARQEWLLYLNKHPEVRGAVGLVSSFLDASGMALSLGKKAYFGQSFGSSSDWR